MIIVPELETIVLLTPRTGSGSLKRALLAKYPSAIQLYRHMEADGVPAGYDRWSKVGVVRHPLERLWSLYKFLQTFGGNPDSRGSSSSGDHDPVYISAQRASVQRPFDEWIVDNMTVFTSPYDSAGTGRYFPLFTVRHPLPETRKSQFLTLRPDLGTEIFRFDQVDRLALFLGVTLDRHNATRETPCPDLGTLGSRAVDHMCKFFAWDWTNA